jgi:hypothetical protein
MTRASAGLVALLAALAIVAGVAFGGGLASLGGPAEAGSSLAIATVAPATPPGGSPSGPPSASPSPSPTPVPTPSPSPTPVLVPDPLDGVLVPESQAGRHPIAVMVDDLAPARPQSGFSSASVVWQAPAEGGIPRYMMVFSHGTPTSVGPVRSARQYFVAWAAEWNALYVHAGGSPQALATLRQQGGGQLVYNADQFRYGPYFKRVTTRFSPHNLYTDGTHLRQLAKVAGATAPVTAPIWQFGPDAPLEARPVGGRLEVAYPANDVRYAYDRTTNTYLRTVTGEGAQRDAATGARVAPKNVVIMRMSFGPLNDGEPQKHRLEAQVVGSGRAWIATNGRTILGTWRKKDLSSPTLFFDRAGNEVTLTVGQTFVQVVPLGWGVVVKDGTLPGSEASPSGATPSGSGPTSGASASASPGPS